MTDVPRNVKIPGKRLSNIAGKLLNLHPLHGPRESTVSHPEPLLPVKIVCISDTHNNRPAVPPGDVLIHAGDLTENGSFDELQTQLNWLSSQPHEHKIVIAGNHDVLLDKKFLEDHPERKYGQTKTSADLDWGSIQYLQDTSKTLIFQGDTNKGRETRRLKIYGSPRTQRYVVSAFQYPPEDDIWSGTLPEDTDILISHGPPRLYLDSAGLQKAGCVHLAKRIHKVRPRLVVFGHIHASYGQMDVTLNRSRQLHDDIINRWGGYWALSQLAIAVAFANLRAKIFGIEKLRRSEQVTTFVNASVVGGSRNEYRNEPITVVV